MTRHAVILIHTHTVVEEADQRHRFDLNSTHRERAVHMIDQSQGYGWYISLKVPLDEVYGAIKE